jgi:hypothetical protein
MNDADSRININILYGTVETQQRPICNANGFGYETRSVCRDRDGNITEVGEWQPPLVYLIYGAQAKARRSWIDRIINVFKAGNQR